MLRLALHVLRSVDRITAMSVSAAFLPFALYSGRATLAGLLRTQLNQEVAASRPQTASYRPKPEVHQALISGTVKRELPTLLVRTDFFVKGQERKQTFTGYTQVGCFRP